MLLLVSLPVLSRFIKSVFLRDYLRSSNQHFSGHKETLLNVFNEDMVAAENQRMFYFHDLAPNQWLISDIDQKWMLCALVCSSEEVF